MEHVLEAERPVALHHSSGEPGSTHVVLRIRAVPEHASQQLQPNDDDDEVMTAV